MMVTYPNGALSDDGTNKLNGCMVKWKLRKVSAVRTFPPRCGQGLVRKSAQISVTENVGLEVDATNDLEVETGGGGGGISATDLMEAETVSSVAADKSSATGEHMDSGGLKFSNVGFNVLLDGMEISETDLMEVEIQSFGAGDKSSAAKEKDMDSGGVKISDVGIDVLLGGDGISETGLVEVKVESFEAGDKSSVSGKDMDSGGVKISEVGVDSRAHESGTSIVGVNTTDLVDVPAGELTETALCVENTVMEAGSLEMQLQNNKVDGQIDEAKSVAIQAEGEKSCDVMVGRVATQVNIFSNDVDELAIEAEVKGVYLMNAVRSDSSEGSAKVERGDSMLKELNKMDGLASGHNAQMEAKPVLGGASADKILLPAPSHSLSSIHEYSTSDRIKFRRRKVCAIRDFPPNPRRNFSLPKEDNLLRWKSFDVERKANMLYRSGAVVHNSGKEANGIHEKKIVNNFSAGKTSHREVVHGLMAGPYCPWTNGEVPIYSGGKMKQPKRKSIPVSYSSPKQRSEGRSRKRPFRDWCDTEGSSGSSTFLKNEDYVAFTEKPARATPISMFTPDLGHLPGKVFNRKSSHSALEEDRDLISGTISKLKKTELISRSSIGARGVEMHKNTPFWQRKSSAVAKKTICSEKKSRNQAKNGFSADSQFIVKTKDFDVRRPRLGPNYRNCGDARSRVRETLMYFHCICRKLLQKEEGLECKSKLSGKKLTRLDLAALNKVKDEGKCVNTEKQILGEVPGVEVGDEFQYRAELAVVGMHRHLQAGIDSMEHDGIPIAISIVASGSYNDDTEHADVLIYSGQGGNVVGKNKNYEDQKLERGNLALSNSMKKGTPVRVVRGWTETVKAADPLDSRSKLVSIYYYDGLYTVTRYWKEMGSHGKLVYMFELTRNPGQTELAWKELKKACKSKVREGVCIRDISHGKERFPVCAVNVLDGEKPPKFNYISKMMYPDWYRPNPPMGCDCAGRCNDPKKCGCAIRNGGEIPYNRNGAIVEAKPTVYECGPHCKCPPTCYNRVTQRGINIKLEIFKTKRRGWGLRASTSIPSGTFICEYTGELLEDREAEERYGNDEYLFDIGQNRVDSSINYKDIEMAEDGYTIDAFHCGNLGRFINHSCSPNLYAQNVIFDHDDDKMPHVMLFAMENIPPFKELTYHYNYKVNQVFDSNGNVKIKKCFCGSADCSGRMY